VGLHGAATGAYSTKRGLDQWESEWYRASLPTPPATLLVTAAGSGREAAALVAQGYTVDALEPEPGFAARCATIPGLRAVVVADHDQLAAAVLDEAPGPAAVLSDRTYDAVIVGWGSFTHLLDPAGRIRLARAADRLTPNGAILLSFFAAGDRPLTASRAKKLGRALGARVARRRHITPGAAPDDRIVWHLGFVHSCSEAEIDALARTVERESSYEASPYGHATLVAPAPSHASQPTSRR
jgi:hypothetical protein